jgi:signal transduction histidine kinase
MPMNDILVVDDDQLSLDLLSQELTDAGYETRLAGGGEDALDAVRTNGVDLVLLDIMMPRVSGIDVLREIRREHSIADLPVIMVTAKDHSADIVRSLSYGANDYVTKPIDIAVLLARVRTQLHLKRLSDMKDEFMKMATHDLNQPLMTIMTGSSLVLDTVPAGAAMPEEMRDVLSRILTRSEEMRRIIIDFLEFHAVEDGGIKLGKTPTSINDIIRTATEGSEHYYRIKGLSVDLLLDLNLPPVEVDTTRIQQVFQNLLHNAIKFSGEGGKITVATSFEDGRAVVELADSGPGLSEEEMRKVFDRPERLSPQSSGGEKSFGFGLAICRRLVDLHGGEIGVRNNEGPGATFWFRIPVI